MNLTEKTEAEAEAGAMKSVVDYILVQNLL